MDIEKEIKKLRPNLSDSSIKTYTSTLSNLYKNIFGTGDVDIKNFSKDEKILNYLKDKLPNKRKSILSALVVITGDDAYRKQMIDDIGVYNENENKQIKNEKQNKNWIEESEINELYNKYEKMFKFLMKQKNFSNKDLQTIQDYIILCLLGGKYIPPRRSKDYVDFKIFNIDKNKDNYIKNKTFVFNSYKTSKTYHQQCIDIPKELYTILKKWIKINPTEFLLFDINLNQLSNVKLNQRLNKIFDSSISVNMLRHIYLSNKFQDTIDVQKELDKTFEDMGSSNLQTKVYIKKNKSKL